MKATRTQELLVQQLRDLYSAETRQIDTLAEMMDAAGTQELRDVIALHLGQTVDHLNRIEEICRILRANPRGARCIAMEILSRQSLELIVDPSTASFRDSAMMDFARRIDQYEIGGYYACLTYVSDLGLDHVGNIIEHTLSEEMETERILSEMAAQCSGHANESITAAEEVNAG